MAKKFEPAKVEEKPEIKKTKLQIHEIEKDAAIVNVDGWRIRVYFGKDFSKEGISQGREIEVSYEGDINDVHSLKFHKLK